VTFYQKGLLHPNQHHAPIKLIIDRLQACLNFNPPQVLIDMKYLPGDIKPQNHMLRL